MVRSTGLFVHTAGPNAALVKSSGRKDVRVVIGGRMFSIPIIQRVDRLSLALRTITVHTKNGLTINGVSVDVSSACQVKVQGWLTADDASNTNAQNRTTTASGLSTDSAAIRLAAQHFLGKTDAAIEDAIQATVAGHQRAIIGCLTVEELYRDREAFCKRVLDLISSDMRNMGLVVVSYTVAEISDANGYINALGVTQTEIVKREAVEGAAQHQAAAKSRSATEDARSHLDVNTQKQRKIQSDKERAITDAKAQELIERQVAIQRKAHDISSAEQDAILFVTQQKARAAETEAELEVVKQQVEKERLVKQKQIHVEADAMLYKAQMNADGIKINAEAEAERLRLIGQAEADAIRQKGLAEVEVLRERNRAWQESINSGAILEKIIEVLPEVAKQIAAPLAQTEKMVFVGGGGQGGGGPAAFTKDFQRIVAEVPEVVNAITGVDLPKAIKALGSSSTGDAVVQGAAEGLATSLVQNKS